MSANSAFIQDNANARNSPGSYALTLTRDDVVVWIINHDVSFAQHAVVNPVQLTILSGHRL